MTLEQLKKQYHNCTKCPELVKSRTQVVFGAGKKKAQILFIGEAPGANEDKQGIPFCGMSGQVLEQLLKSVNLNREDVFITNTVLCRPLNNRNPKKEEVENCRERLDELIRIMQPKVIVTIGNFATERILGWSGIKSIRGKIYPLILNHQPVKVVPMIHPASYLYSGRNPHLFELMKKDFRTIAELVKINKSQKSLIEY